jgi:hypothetical protein
MQSVGPTVPHVAPARRRIDAILADVRIVCLLLLPSIL